VAATPRSITGEMDFINYSSDYIPGYRRDEGRPTQELERTLFNLKITILSLQVGSGLLLLVMILMDKYFK
jgi:hypothetical protein